MNNDNIEAIAFKTDVRTSQNNTTAFMEYLQGKIKEGYIARRILQDLQQQ